MKKQIFELIISPFSLFENPLLDFLAISVIGYISFIVAYRAVGETEFRGCLGSWLHWIIRTIVFVLVWSICCVILNVILFVSKYWLNCLIIIVLVLFLRYAKNKSEEEQSSIYNKILF